MKYTDAEALMNKARDRKNGKPLENNTRLFDRGDHFAVQLHSTDIVGLYPDGSFTLNTGGWYSKVTKNRMAGYAPTDAYIQSRKGIWHIISQRSNFGPKDEHGNKPFIGSTILHDSEFYDGMRFGSDGLPLKPLVPDNALVDRLDRSIRKYKKEFCAEMVRIVKETGKLPRADNGDCWGCSMVTAQGKNDILTGVTHYFHHFNDHYYVPALLERAILEGGSHPGIVWSMMESDLVQGRSSFSLTNGLTRYFMKRKPEMLEALRNGSATLDGKEAA